MYTPTRPSRFPRLVAVACLVFVACGGNVTESPDRSAGGTSGGGGTSGTGGSGGSGVGGVGGSGVGGIGGGMGGVAGTGPGGVGGGGSGGGIDAGTCQPVPSCNWCGGINIYDVVGCVIGYRCGNGVDPCVTQPCVPGSLDCGAGMHCEDDMLCWPGSVCGDKQCGVTSVGDCDCSWGCPDGFKYRTYCVWAGSGSQSCECSVNGEVTHGCAETMGSAGGPGDWCGSPTCCGFPE